MNFLSRTACCRLADFARDFICNFALVLAQQFLAVQADDLRVLADESPDEEDLFANVEQMQAMNFADYRAYCQELCEGASINTARLLEEDDQ